MMSTLCALSVVSSGVGGRGELSLAEVQCHLDKEGASDLVIDLIMNATSDRIFQESILLAIALLEGGNTVIQASTGSSRRCTLLTCCYIREGLTGLLSMNQPGRVLKGRLHTRVQKLSPRV